MSLSIRLHNHSALCIFTYYPTLIIITNHKSHMCTCHNKQKQHTHKDKDSQTQTRDTRIRKLCGRAAMACVGYGMASTVAVAVRAENIV